MTIDEIKMIRNYLTKLENYRDEYLAAQSDSKLDPETNADFFKGKYHAYRWAAEELKNHLAFLGIEI